MLLCFVCCYDCCVYSPVGTDVAFIVGGDPVGICTVFIIAYTGGIRFFVFCARLF